MSKKIEVSEVFDFINKISQILFKKIIDPADVEEADDLRAAMTSLIDDVQIFAKSQTCSQDQLNSILNMVIDLAGLKFNQRLELVGDNGPVDGLVTGINMLSEELEYSVVARSELERSEGEFRSIYEQGGVGVAFVSLDGKIIKCNDRYSALYQTTPEELTGRSVADFIAPEDRAINLTRLSQLVSGEIEHWVTERKFARSDGSITWCLLNSTCVRDQRGAPLYVAAIFQDITNQKLNELERERIHKFLDIVLQNIPSMIFVKDCKKDFSFSLLNQAGEVLLGVKHDQVLGKTDYDFFSKEQADILRQQDKMLLDSRTILKIEKEEIVTPQGKKIMSTQRVPIFDKDGEPYLLIGIADDITEELRIKFKIEQDRLIVLEQSKLASLGEMASSIVHEINNSLAIIQGKTKQLLRYIQDGRFTSEYGSTELEKIVKNSERIGKIIKGLRSFSGGVEKDPFAPFELKTLVSNVLDLCAERFKVYQISLEVDPIPDITIQCRGIQIEQVLLNLLNNAHDAVVLLEDKWTRIKFKNLGDKIQILVIDSGKGIPLDIVDKLMQPFFTTKETGKGTGLGLSISKGIIEDHHGRLCYDSSYSNTCFVIELPIVQKK